ncbi:hypothetical protein BH10PSE1_BH10PSE1_13690 [soil metagenome]
MSLERLTYTSTATGSTGSLLNLAAILAESHRNNARDGLTGVLAAHRERYIQVVEGSASALDSLLKRLGHDVRHRHIGILDRVPAHSRLFADWTMASPRITPAMQATLDGLMSAENPRPDEVLSLLVEAVRIGHSQPA